VIINHALLLHPSVPADNVKDLVALAKKKPGALNYGTFGAGSTGHLNMEMFQTLSGTKLTAVHYKGATPALTDVIGGHIQAMFISVGTAVPQWRERKVKFIAVGAGQRMPLLPEMPTVAESGVPGYEAVSWFALFGPPGMPKDIVAKINAEVRRMFADPELRKTLDSQYFTPIVGSPEELAARVKAEEPKWRKVIQAAGLQPQ
jgi:tripartite-type tricarboxylate transporter receptor subunit TctC